MYSIVLMMAMTQGAAAPEWHDADSPKPSTTSAALTHRQYRGRRCNGGGGCNGGGWGGRGGGCNGGGWGGRGGGCYGGGWGCSGGGGWGGGGWGCHGGGQAGCWGGCSGGRMAYAGSMPGGYAASPYSPVYYTASNGYIVPAGTPYGYSSGYFGQVPATGTANQSAAATFVVSLPADAKLTIDDTPTTSTTSTRTFLSPPLEPGKDFRYTLKAEMMRDGKPLTTTKEITVRAGQETRVTLEFPEPTPEDKP